MGVKVVNCAWLVREQERKYFRKGVVVTRIKNATAGQCERHGAMDRTNFMLDVVQHVNSSTL